MARRTGLVEGYRRLRNPTEATTRRQVQQLRQQLAAARQRERAAQARAAAAERARDGLAQSHRRLEAALRGVPPQELPLRSKGPGEAEGHQLTAAMRVAVAQGAMVDTLRRGGDLNEATVQAVRRVLVAGHHVRARSLGHALLQMPGSRVAGHLATGLVARHQKITDLAWHHLRQAPRDVWQDLVPVEYLDTAYAEAPDVAREECARILAEPHPTISDADWFAIATTAYGAGDEEGAAALVFALDARREGRSELAGRAADEFGWLLAWLRAERARAAAPDPPRPAGPAFAVLDYKQPDRLRTSSNLGDYVQTLASLSHLARFQAVRFPSDELGDLMTRLQDRVPERLRIPAAERVPVHLVPVNRDRTSTDLVPEGTWLLAFGWYMHTLFGRRLDFPFHPNLRPLFVSFHVNRRAMITDEAVAYLRRYAPVGCRDWTTVYLLHSVGVPAFFSGCLTTTVDGVFPDGGRPAAEAAPGTVAYVDIAPEADGEDGKVARITQALTDVRDSGLVPNLVAAERQLEEYRHGYRRIVTSRLHCYLPATALGVEVDFHPRNLADVRFDGLLGMAPGRPALTAMQDRIRDTVAAAVERILAGAGEEEVYAAWREACAPAVAEAEARMAEPPPTLRPSFDVRAACATARAAARSVPAREHRSGDVVDVAFALDANLREQLPVVLEGVCANTARPLRLWVLTRGLTEEDFSRYAREFPAASFTFVPCDHVDYGPVLGMLKHITVSTMDRLLLPELLTEVSRIVYHDVDALALADVGELFDTDLEGHLLAARSSRLSWAESGFSNVYRACTRLSAEVARELRHRMHARHAFDFPAFNAGIMVLDLDRMRADQFCDDWVPFVERYGMNDQEVLNCYAGPHRKVLPGTWNSVPSQEVVVAPRLIHWAGPLKPWGENYVLFADVWAEYRDRYERRTGRRVDTAADEPLAAAGHPS